MMTKNFFYVNGTVSIELFTYFIFLKLQSENSWIVSYPGQVLILCFSLSFVEEFYLSVPENYHYLSQSGCIGDKTISDQESFREVIVSYFLIFPLLRVTTSKKKSGISFLFQKKIFLMKIEVIKFAPLYEKRYFLLVPNHGKECSKKKKNKKECSRLEEDPLSLEGR